MAKRKPKPEGIGPTPERRRHGNVIVIPGLTGKAHRLDLPDYYDLLYRQGKITRDEHAALETFHSVYRQAYGSDCQIARYDKGIGGGQGGGQQYALIRVRELGVHMQARYGWIEGLVIDGHKMRPLERKMGVRHGSGLAELVRAIRVMTDFWGLPNEGH